MSFFQEKLIELGFEAKTKDDVLNKLCGMLNTAGVLNDEATFRKAVNEREEEGSTAIGYSYAIPHGKSPAVKESTVAFIRLQKPLQWDDDETVQYVFLLAINDVHAKDEHLHLLMKLSGSILEDDFREEMEKAKTSAEVFDIISDYTSRNF